MRGNRPETGRIRLTITEPAVSIRDLAVSGGYWRMLMGLTMSAVSVNTVRPPNSKITR
jgi:hypothetical protein